MTVHHLTPWLRKSSIAADDAEPRVLRGLQRDIDSVFDNFFRGFTPSLKDFNTQDLLTPSLDIAETDKEYHLSVELPGVDEKDIDVSLNNGVLTISGEKKSEEKKEGKNYHRVERSYGSFQRSLSLPEEVDANKVEATYKKGVLDVHIPKLAIEKEKTRKITVKGEK